MNKELANNKEIFDDKTSQLFLGFGGLAIMRGDIKDNPDADLRLTKPFNVKYFELSVDGQGSDLPHTLISFYPDYTIKGTNDHFDESISVKVGDEIGFEEYLFLRDKNNTVSVDKIQHSQDPYEEEFVEVSEEDISQLSNLLNLIGEKIN